MSPGSSFNAEVRFVIESWCGNNTALAVGHYHVLFTNTQDVKISSFLSSSTTILTPFQ